MSKGAGGEPKERAPLVVTGEGVTVMTGPGVPARSRGEAGGGDALSRASEGTDDVRAIDSATITWLEPPAATTRGSGGAQPAISVRLDPTPAERQVVLVEEEGQFTWAFPGPGDTRVRLPVEGL